MQDKYANMQAIYVNMQLICGNMQGKKLENYLSHFIAAAQIACPKIFLKFLSEFMQFLKRLRR